MRRILAILAAAFCLTACFEDSGDDPLYTNFYGFADVSGLDLTGARISIRSEGIFFNVAEDKTDGAWRKEKRIFLQCDVLRQTADNTYDICLKQTRPVIEKDVIFKSQSSEDVYGNDAVSFDQDWGMDVQTRTINMACRYTALQKSTTPHTLNLVFDDSRSTTDTLFFELRHQGAGESYENTDYETTDFQVNGQYLTFDFSGTIPAGAKGSIVISVEWDWLNSNSYEMLERERKHYQSFGTLKLSQ